MVMLPAHIKIVFVFILMMLLTQTATFAQHQHALASSPEIISNVEPQPLLAQAMRLNDALSFLCSALSREDAKHLK